MPTTPPADAIIWYDINELQIWKDNYNEGDIGAIAMSIRRFGFNSDPRTWQGPNVRGGNHTVQAIALIKREGPNPAVDLTYPPARIWVDGDTWRVACADISHLDETQAIAFAVADNRSAQKASQDTELLLQYLHIFDGDPTTQLAMGYDDDDIQYLEYIMEQDNAADEQQAGAGGAADAEQARTTLASRFIIPPFTILDARQGYWQERKRAWIALGIQGELGRGGDLLTLNAAASFQKETGTGRKPTNNPGSRGDTRPDPAKAWQEKHRQDGLTKNGKRKGAAFGQDLVRGEHSAQSDYGYASDEAVEEAEPGAIGTSIFDPVLCEVAYRWFCPPGGLIVNPTAGESVYGLVAGLLGYQYKGVELRIEQIESNRAQAQALQVTDSVQWIEGDGRQVHDLVQTPADFIMCCPPYFDLEIYSDLPTDLSNADDYAAFIADYRTIVAQSARLLKNNRFACFTVGDIRDKQGNYRNFVSDTIQAFLDVGMHLYNEAILVTAVGSLPVRVAAHFANNRKLGKTHQNVLIFVKGDWREAVKDCGEVDVYIPEGLDVGEHDTPDN